jgi:hypothetical protein
MTLTRAKTKATRQIVVGLVLMLVALVLLLMTLTLTVYQSTYNDQSLLRGLANLVNRLAVAIYQKTQFLAPVWEIAPVFHFPDMLVEDNLKPLAILGVLILGVVMLDSGVNLKRRINRARRRADEKGWERDLAGETSGRIPTELEISIESKDTWYTRPIGTIALAVIGGYLVNVLSKLSGL